MADKVFNPPPGWPVPPPGWRPPPGWEPDPEWGPAPEGWELFVRPNRHPWRWSFGTSIALYVALMIGITLAGGISAYAAGGLFSTVAFFPGLVCALIARTRGRRWPWWAYLLTVLALVLVFATLQALGSADDA